MGEKVLVVKDGRLVTPRKVIKNGVLLIEGSKIVAVSSEDGIDIPSHSKVISADNQYVAPGFIDIHVNGGGGGDALDGTLEAIEKMVQTHVQSGTTSMVPTIITAPIDKMIKAVENIGRVKKKALNGSEVLGAFLEGPYISSEQKGAHNPEYIKVPNPREYQKFLELSKHILVMGLAPELPGSLELGRSLLKENILPAIAHSNASYSETMRAIDMGFSHVVHLFSSLSRWSKKIGKAEKIAGVTEAALVSDELSTELIGDGKHVPAGLLQLTLKAKGLSNICVVTDAIHAAGLPPGKYQLGGLDIIIEDNVAKLTDYSNFAGSVATMDLCVRNMVNMAGLSIQDAVKTATVNPARIIGMQERKGALVEGKDADVVIFDKDINISTTIVGGKVIYRANKD